MGLAELPSPDLGNSLGDGPRHRQCQARASARRRVSRDRGAPYGPRSKA